MKRIKNFMLFVALFATAFVSCETENPPPEKIFNKVAYVTNYGSYSGSKSEISIYDTDSSLITHDAYKAANSVDFTSNIESMSIHEDIAYFMSNNGDKIDIVDAKTLQASVNPISTDITKPRYFAADGNIAYISCWGDVDDWNVMANSYIAKIDLSTKTVAKIALPGGPEGVTIIGNKLYAALTTTKKIAVIDLSSNDISYINTLAIPYHFVVDDAGYLWASMVSTYTVPVGLDSVGLTQIDPANNEVLANVNFSSIGSNGFIHISSDKKTVYALGKEAWPGTASSIYSIDVSSQTLSSSALVSGESFNGFGVNPENDNIYVLISPSATENGSLKIYNSSGSLIDEEVTGISPKHVVFYNIEQ
ncbi:MAG: hypothetical protein KAR19_05460 [Bacteroidales bacterium]|nr:hypothetical protein [Bacteroidales bacterium]